MMGCSNKLRPAAILLLLLVQGLSAPEARAQTRAYVLPPISPEKMREFLAPGPDKLPGGYRFAGARIEKVAILARYRSPTGGAEITVLLGYPPQTRGEPLKTRKFALLLHGRRSKQAAVGPGLVQALAAHIRAKEGSWRWVRVTLRPAEVRGLQNFKLNVKPSGSQELYGLFLVLLLLLGPLVSWWYQRRRDSRRPPDAAAPRGVVGWAKGWADGWNRFDLGALSILALFVASVAWPMATSPITGDEATNLEPAFWSLWFMGDVSAVHPPLFRFLIHITTRDLEPLWLLRGPVVLFAVGALWKFWRLAQARTTPWMALALTAALAMSGNHWQHAFEQKSLWLWLLLLLTAHGNFERALAGERQRWAHYVVWSTLAVLTHYLSVAYLAGHVLYVVLRHRGLLVSQVLALAPAALAVLPLSMAILQGGAGRVSGYDPTGSALAQLLSNTVLRTGAMTLLLCVPALVLAPREERKETGLLPVLGIGFGVTLALTTQAPLWPRYFFPLFPLGLLWVAGGLRWRRDRLRYTQVATLVLAALVHLSNSQSALKKPLRAYGATTLYAAYRRAAPPTKAGPHPRVVLLHPGWRFPMVYYQLSGRRHLRATGCKGQRSPFYHVRGAEVLVAVCNDASAARLDRLLADLGQLDVLLYTVRDNSSSRGVSRWIRAHCRPLVAHRSRGQVETGAAFRCRAGQPSGSNVCEALKRFAP